MFDSSKLNWPDKLPSIEMSLRSVTQSSTNFSPFEVLFGKEMRDCEFIDCHLNDTKRKYVLELTKNLASKKSLSKEKFSDKSKKRKENKSF